MPAGLKKRIFGALLFALGTFGIAWSAGSGGGLEGFDLFLMATGGGVFILGAVEGRKQGAKVEPT